MTAGLVTFSEEILNGKPYFLCSESAMQKQEFRQMNQKEVIEVRFTFKNEYRAYSPCKYMK